MTRAERWERFWRFFTSFDFQHEREICGGGHELSTTVRATGFYRSIEVTYVRGYRAK